MKHLKPSDWLIMEDANYLLSQLNIRENNQTLEVEDVTEKVLLFYFALF